MVHMPAGAVGRWACRIWRLQHRLPLSPLCLPPPPQCHTHTSLPAPLHLSFVKELSAVKRKVEEQQDEEACLGLCHIMQSLTACVSVVRERKHDALVRELLSISLWKCPQVGCMKQWAVCFAACPPGVWGGASVAASYGCAATAQGGLECRTARLTIYTCIINQ